MKICVIHGSMRKGNTYGLTKAVISELEKRQDVEINEFCIKDLALPLCISCHSCFKSGEETCPHLDILKPIADCMETSDAIILSGAVYSLHLNAAMKNFIDHFSYYFHRPRLFYQKGLVVTTTAGAADKSTANYLKKTMGHWGIGNIQKLYCKIQTSPFSLTQKQSQKVEKAAEQFYMTIQNQTKSKPTFESVVVHNAFRGMSAAENAISEYDHNYWKKTGLADRIYPYKISFIKSFFGWIVHKILKKVMSKKE